MESNTMHPSPHRITDLIRYKEGGAALTCSPSFDILPVDFEHRKYRFKAYIFLCRYNGDIDGKAYSFRKCYARGCPHNLCPHVSQAVMIANRYLQRDLRRLKNGGIAVQERLFSLDDMVVKYEWLHEDHGPLLTIHDYISMATEGNAVSVDVSLDFVPAVEHFAAHENAQTFLWGDFRVDVLGENQQCQHGFACYPTEKEAEEKDCAVEVANARLEILYNQFDEASIQYTKRFFSA
jgi:hypothetical protein